MKKYLIIFALFIIALISIDSAYALDGSYSSSNFQIFYYNSPSGGTRLSSGYSSGLDVSLSPNGGYVEGLYIQVFGNNNIIYKAGNTYTFDFRVNFNPKKWNYLDNHFTTSNLNVLGSTSASSSGMTEDNITSSSLSITNISGNTYQMHYVFKVVPATDLKYILFQCLYPYSLMGADLEYVYALSTVRVVDLTVSYQQGIGSAIDDLNIAIQNRLDDVINNDNRNTNNIINNNNQNTNNIINNNNQNTDRQIESQKVCKETLIDKTSIFTDNSYLNSSGSFISNSNSGVTDYILIDSSSFEIVTRFSSNYEYMCFYTDNKSLINCVDEYSLNVGSHNFPTNSKYFRSTIKKTTNTPIIKLVSCKNGNQALSDGMNDVNNSLNNSDVGGANSDATGFFNGFSSSNFGLSSIITMPLQFISHLTDNNTCDSLVLPLPFVNTNATLPCMTPIYNTYFHDFLVLYQTITTGFISYWVCVNIFRIVRGFKNPESDQVEVMDL